MQTKAQNKQSKNADKNAYLYDKMVISDKSANALQNEKVNVVKTEQVKGQTAPKTENAAAIKQETEDLRVPLQVDITQSQENEMRREISNSMSVEAIIEQYKLQSDALREQLNIASAELGISSRMSLKESEALTMIPKNFLKIRMFLKNLKKR